MLGRAVWTDASTTFAAPVAKEVRTTDPRTYSMGALWPPSERRWLCSVAGGHDVLRGLTKTSCAGTLVVTELAEHPRGLYLEVDAGEHSDAA